MGFDIPRPDYFIPGYAHPRPYGPMIPPYFGPRPGLGVPGGFAPWGAVPLAPPYPAGYANAGPVGPLGPGGVPLIAQNAPIYTGPYTDWGWGYGASLRGYGPGFAGSGFGTTGPSLGGFVPGLVTQPPAPFTQGIGPAGYGPSGAGQGVSQSPAYGYRGAGGVPSPSASSWAQAQAHSNAQAQAQSQAGAVGPYYGVGPQVAHSDFRIHDDIHERMTAHGNLDARGLTISVDHGVVTLNGVVPDRAQKRLAEDIVDSVSGVKDVVNHLSVQPQHFAQAGSSAHAQA